MMPAAGGTVYRRTNVDVAAGSVTRLAFYGINTYNSAQSTFQLARQDQHRHHVGQLRQRVLWLPSFLGFEPRQPDQRHRAHQQGRRRLLDLGRRGCAR